MAKQVPSGRNYIRIDAQLWSDDAVNELSKTAQRAWLILSAWSKDQKRDGAVTTRALRVCDVTDSERDELISAGFLLPAGEGWLLSDSRSDPKRSQAYSLWQTTEDEVAQSREAKRAAGRAGAAVLWRGKEEPETAPSAIAIADAAAPISCDRTDTAAQLAARIDRAWPAPTGKYQPQSPAKLADLLDGVDRSLWPRVVDHLNERLKSYHVSTHEDRRRHLGAPCYQVERYAESVAVI